MTFPSGYLKRWFAFFNPLLQEEDNPYRTAHHRDGFCECEIKDAVNYGSYVLEYPMPGFCEPVVKGGDVFLRASEYQKHMMVSFFWGNWIDEVLQFKAGEEVYEEFSQMYPFPKLYCHHGPWGWPVKSLLCEMHIQIEEELLRCLLKEYKDIFWGDVSAWLESTGRKDIRDKAINAFKSSSLNEEANGLLRRVFD